jgi:AFG3 family protein
MPQAHIEEAEATAYHEMGHAVTAFTTVTGQKVVKVTIVPERIGDSLSAAGYTQYKSVPRKGSYDRDYLVKSLAGLLAGSEAEAMFLGHEAHQRNVGRSNDVQRTGELARRMILDYHLMPELDAAHAYKDSKGDIIENLPEDLKSKFDKYVADAIKEARELSLTYLKENWGLVKLGSDFLMRFGGNMSGDEYELLETKWMEAKAAGRDIETINLESVRGYKKPKCEDRLH